MDCHNIPEIRYSDWSAAFHDKVAAKRIPITGSLELTFRCNNNCLHCYCNKPAHDRVEMSRELSAREIFRIIDDIADDGCLWLLVTGGEPLLRPDFKEIYLHAKKKGMLITLFTNGTLISDEIADFLAEWRPFSTEITLYGGTEKTYEEITRAKGSYKRCIRGIELFIQREIPLKLKTTAMKQNMHEIPVMKSYAEDIGLEFRFDPMINGRLDMDRNPLSARLNADDVIRLDLEDEKRSRAWGEVCSNNMGHPALDLLYSCSAGLDSFHIDPYGNLCPCIMARKDFYNLRAGTFRAGWDTLMKRLRERTLNPDNKCRECDIASICCQCPGWSQVEYGDDESPVDFLCEVAHKSAEAFGLKRKEGNERRTYEKTL